MRALVLCSVLAAVACGTSPAFANETAQLLPPLGVDPASVTVSGLSSGAYMSVQMETAFSAKIKGAAVFAGGPFGCARGDGSIATLTESLMHCVNVDGSPIAYQGPPNAAALAKGAAKLAAEHAIDPLENMQSHKLFLFSGSKDPTVPTAVMESLEKWYATVAPQASITKNFSVSAGHAMVTTDYGSACADTKLPFINDCDDDGAGQALTTLYGTLQTPADEGGTILTIDQHKYIPKDGPSYNGLHQQAHLFVPDSCRSDQASGQGCRLHVVFHGCKQNQDFIQDQYWTKTGYNRWAAANRIVVLYPQTKASDTSMMNPMGLPNPNGCWDWWGFTGQDYLTKKSIQMRTVEAMIAALEKKAP